MKQIIQRLEERLEESDRRHEANHQEIVLLRSEMQRKDLHTTSVERFNKNCNDYFSFFVVNCFSCFETQ